MKYLKNLDKISLQKIIAVASFSVGTILGSVCLLFIEPIGEISDSAIGLISEFLILCGACLGISATFDTKLAKLKSGLMDKIENK